MPGPEATLYFATESPRKKKNRGSPVTTPMTAWSYSDFATSEQEEMLINSKKSDVSFRKVRKPHQLLLCNSSKVSRLDWWMQKTVGAQPLHCSLPAAVVVSHSSADPSLDLSPPRCKKTKKQTKKTRLPFGAGVPRAPIRAKTLCWLRSCLCLQIVQKKKKKVCLLRCPFRGESFPVEGEKTQDSEGSTVNQIFPREEKDGCKDE